MAADRENKKSNQTLREFKGVNTRNARTVIHDDQFAWLENVMPIGSGNMVAVPGPGSSLALWPTAVYMMESVNLNNVTDKKYLTSLYWTQSLYAAPRNGSATLTWTY